MIEIITVAVVALLPLGIVVFGRACAEALILMDEWLSSEDKDHD